ncbi:Protein of unknown function [Caloramator fervidus]|uniref:DUF4446 domain-containing protein n=1 Tax=Caloramator fervidus TaxID=29344 RepID=A0A1H5WGH2_9CLOT|nr:DUF4446 family protein [Caloramator fervidus]SEF98376.1 Protein of unknown function [Caloramator fervidus]
MDIIYSFLQDFQIPILIILLVLVIILLFMDILNRIEISRLEKRYKKMMRGTTGKNIEELIMENNAKIDEALELTKKVVEAYEEVDNRLKNCIQKVAVMRYRAFDDVGSDLSFSIALLDDNNDGVIITGIYGRNESTAFAKPIINGISKYDLSEEEKAVLKEAMNKNKLH